MDGVSPVHGENLVKQTRVGRMNLYLIRLEYFWTTAVPDEVEPNGRYSSQHMQIEHQNTESVYFGVSIHGIFQQEDK